MSLRKYRFCFFQPGLNQIPYTCRGGLDRKNFDFDPCKRVMIVRKFQKKRNNFDLSVFYFIVLRNDRFDGYPRNQDGIIFIFRRLFDEEKTNFNPCIKNAIVRKLQKVLLMLIYLHFQTHFYSLNQASFLQSRSRSRTANLCQTNWLKS